mmetsp:Transcript_11806/g.34881  ORF Transcript_11806/g.34881 Transcript_11806/m.34881 type:complete len:205 (-) Transcript_11806:670-1284(-)
MLGRTLNKIRQGVEGRAMPPRTRNPLPGRHCVAPCRAAAYASFFSADAALAAFLAADAAFFAASAAAFFCFSSGVSSIMMMRLFWSNVRPAPHLPQSTTLVPRLPGTVSRSPKYVMFSLPQSGQLPLRMRPSLKPMLVSAVDRTYSDGSSTPHSSTRPHGGGSSMACVISKPVTSSIAKTKPSSSSTAGTLSAVMRAMSYCASE